ncbi:MAG TPA: hypothetical protein VGN64_10205, partial [Dyadobacter sp.]|nr:hypothetical protein [Dyadobacter sp.]
FTREYLTAAINHFINDADETRTNYISQLADSTFTSFALTSDAETLNFLNQRYNHLQLFLDTNFIFGVLNLHKNGEDTSAREILEEVKRNRLPFKLGYHPETLLEFKRAFDSKALHLQASRWSRETSRIALLVDGLSPLEELFHKENIENEIDPSVFLDKYDHVDMILKDLGLIEFVPHRVSNDDEMFDIEKDVDTYKDFYDTLPNRKPKSYLNFKHDIIALREVRSLNPRKTKFLESNAFFVSSDYIFGKFEKKYFKKNWEINYVVSPSTFLQLIRPFVENDYQSNKRFIDNFAIPEFRSFEIDYSTTRSKALQILNDNYHDTSFETKVKILRDQVLLEKLELANENFEKQIGLIENHIALQNKVLTDEKNRVMDSIREMQVEKDNIALEKNKIEQERITAINEIISKEEKLELANYEINKLKELHAVDSISQQITHKSGLMSLLDESINSNTKREVPIMKIIDDRFKMRRLGILSIVIIYCATILYLIYKLSWEVMEPITYVLTLISALIGYSYLAIKAESFDPSKYFDYVKESITSQVYREFEFDLPEFQLQKEKRKELEEEIRQLNENLKTHSYKSGTPL